ncbi:MAG: DUF1223 domain-containing protein [Chthoniobacteraceae bacterium]
MTRHLAAAVAAILPAIFALGNPRAASAAPQEFQSPAAQVTLVELYTSEGCSSCPPAEAWLSHFKDSPGLWKTFVPVAFHVDYWDHLGWPDPWASKAFTERQRAYAAAWNTSTIYTPAFVRNGHEWQQWRESGTPYEPTTAKSGILHASSTDGTEWKITFTPGKDLTGGEYEIHAALLGSALHSNVRAGENKGRQLIHDFVVLAITQAPAQSQEGKKEATIKLPIKQPNPDSKDTGKPAIAIWITRPGDPAPLQSTGAWLTQ